MLFHYLLEFSVAVEKSHVSLTLVPLYVIFSESYDSDNKMELICSNQFSFHMAFTFSVLLSSMEQDIFLKISPFGCLSSCYRDLLLVKTLADPSTYQHLSDRYDSVTLGNK